MKCVSANVFFVIGHGVISALSMLIAISGAMWMKA